MKLMDFEALKYFHERLKSSYITDVLVTGDKVLTFVRGDGTLASLEINGETYSLANDHTNGLMSADDKIKLEAIEPNANNYVHPVSENIEADLEVNPDIIYKSVSVDKYGHIVGGTNPTTLKEYGITDVKIDNGTITLGDSTLTPLTAGSPLSADKIEGKVPLENLPDSLLTTSSEINASNVKGILSIDNIPQGALERLVVVPNDEALYNLTVDEVQKGDTVKVASTGIMYYVVDDTKLDSPEGYEVYTAGSATSVPWSGVTNKPTTVEDYGITNLSDVATSGEYKDLKGLPSIPVVQDTFDSESSDAVSGIAVAQAIGTVGIHMTLDGEGNLTIASTHIESDIYDL